MYTNHRYTNSENTILKQQNTPLSKNVYDSSYCCSLISDTITLDIAVLCQEYSPIEVACNNNHIIELDEILITEDIFKQIFYPYGENFGIDKKICSNNIAFKYITFLPPWRTLHCGEPFSLLEQIILNIESDLNVTRNCFATCTLIELSKELSNIKSLSDINCCNILCSIPWSNILNIISNDYKTRDPLNPLKQTILIISVVFKTPNASILPTIIKFKYRMDINVKWVL
jgi:hypothetical protein